MKVYMVDKGDSVQCPECERKTVAALDAVEFDCTGKWEPHMIGHKPARMVKV